MGSSSSKSKLEITSSQPNDQRSADPSSSEIDGGHNTTEAGKKENGASRKQVETNGKNKPIPPLPKEKPEEIVTATVCNYDDMKDGEMKTVDIGSGKVLLVRDEGEYSAIGHKCTHYGASLANGALCNGRVRCPWHGACFNVKTGDIEDFPGLDSVPAFDVEVQNGKVIVKANKKKLESHKRTKQMSCYSPVDDERTFLIVGGGGAGNMAAETLRQEGFKGQVIMATKETCRPYDRPKLSKALNSTGDALALRTEDFYSVYDIEIQTEKEAKSVDTMLRSVTFQDGSSINYDSLLIATGGRPRQLSVKGDSLEGICYLRTPQNGNYIHENAKDKEVVIIGNSFIGMEVAAYFIGKAASVTVIGRSSIPFKPVLGEKVGSALKQLFIDKGVKFVDNSGVIEFKGENNKLTEVVLKDETTLKADICVVGAGVTPATDFFTGSDIARTTSGHVIVNQFMKTNKENVFAAGDIAQFPMFLTGGESVNIGHWQMAHSHGRVAALNMLGQEIEIRTVPYFWTMVFGKSVRYTGFGAGYENVIIHGNLDDLNFAAFYTKGDRVIAVASLNFDPIVSQAAEVFAAGKAITVMDIKEDPKGFLLKLG